MITRPTSNLLIRSKFALGDGRSKGGLVFDDKYLLINGRPSQTVMMLGEFNIIIGPFFFNF